MKANTKSNIYRATIVLVVLGILSALLIGGCKSNRNENRAEKIVVEFFEYLYEKDYGSALPLCTERCLEQITMFGESAFVKVRRDHSRGGNIYTANKLVAIEHGRNTIEIYSEDGEEEDDDLRIWLIRTRGKWYIDEFEWKDHRDDWDHDRDRDEYDDDRDRDRDRNEYDDDWDHDRDRIWD